MSDTQTDTPRNPRSGNNNNRRRQGNRNRNQNRNRNRNRQNDNQNEGDGHNNNGSSNSNGNNNSGFDHNHNRNDKRERSAHPRQRQATRSHAPIEINFADLDFTVPADKTIVIGITGEPGAGKSALAQEFVKLGATLIDADSAGHAAIEMPATKKKITACFGDDILNEDGSINRAQLAAKAFADSDSIATLNTIVHPKILIKIKAALKKAGNFAIIDAAVLSEIGAAELCTYSIYVRSPNDVRLARVVTRGWDADELARRETALGDSDERRRLCALTVDNSGDLPLLTTYAHTILARQLGIDLVAARKKAEEAHALAQQATADANQHAAHDNNSDAHNSERSAKPAPEAREIVRLTLNDYLARSLPDLQEEAEKLEVRDAGWLDKHDLICEILRRVAGHRNDIISVEGHLEVHKEQHAYLRNKLNQYTTCNTDAFISGQQLRKFGLKAGMHITATARAPRGNERNLQLLGIDTVMGEELDQRTRVQNFASLTPLHAEDRLFMERSEDPYDISLRVIDLIAPIGKGQRGLIVAQPKCGKTVYLQKIANAITSNNPEVELMVLLIDERPEEVTDMARSIKGEVVASTFDQVSARHVQIAEMVLNKSKRLVEHGKDVVILLDSITRLGRAYNAEAPSSGRIMSGGLEASALIRPKQFFGAARNIENGGSLTILATALVDTGSVMDTVIFEEFKGTGNMELVLDRRLSNRRIFPAVDVAQSGTRKDDLLITDPNELKCVWALRKFLAERSPEGAMEFLKKELKKHKTNVGFLMSIDPERMGVSNTKF